MVVSQGQTHCCVSDVGAIVDGHEVGVARGTLHATELMQDLSKRARNKSRMIEGNAL
jgi:hypothetical protein